MRVPRPPPPPPFRSLVPYAPPPRRPAIRPFRPYPRRVTAALPRLRVSDGQRRRPSFRTAAAPMAPSTSAAAAAAAVASGGPKRRARGAHGRTTVTLQTLLDTNILEPGDSVLSLEYMVTAADAFRARTRRRARGPAPRLRLLLPDSRMPSPPFPFLCVWFFIILFFSPTRPPSP